jgi:hypothetical protein
MKAILIMMFIIMIVLTMVMMFMILENDENVDATNHAMIMMTITMVI